MIGIVLFTSVLTATDLDALGTAVAACDRTLVNPAFSSEAARRSEFMRATFREQESIVSERRELAARRLTLRQQAGGVNEAALVIAEDTLEQRQRALNDQRLLEGLRRETMDSMRHHFLQNCPAGKTKS